MKEKEEKEEKEKEKSDNSLLSDDTSEMEDADEEKE
jgi:hypothetical protein